MRSSTKITYVILICLFIGSGCSYLFNHYIHNGKSTSTVQVVQDINTPSTNNPINPSTGIPNKGKILSSLTSGALVYKSENDKTPYGVINSNTIVTLKKKVGSLYEIDYNNELLYISAKDITLNIN